MKKIFTILMLLFMHSAALFAQGSREQDSLALVGFYNNLGGETWTDHTNWLTSEPLDDWFGITVDGGRVTEISMYNNNLSGTIPASIGDLKALTKLFLGDHGIIGTIPAELYTLTNLITINIQNSDIGGTISENVSGLVNLESFQISGCELEGPIPVEICSLPNLTVLNINRNQMSGEIPPEIGNLTNLTYLSLYTNNFEGSIPASIGNLTKLTFLNLYNDKLSGNLPPEIGNLTALTILNISVNQFSGYVPLENMTSIGGIYINNNNFTDLPDLSGFTAITHFKVNNNRFTFEDIEPNIGLTDFIYAPQDSVGAVKDTTIETKQSLALTITVGGSANQYQWFKDGSAVSEASNWPLHIIPDLTMEDAGSYTCKITNTIAQNLTLYSRPLNVTVVPSARDRDSLALVDLYNSTDGANWTNKFNWLTSNPIDTWNGITVSDGRVTGIYLYDNNLSGTIPASLGNLSEMKILNIYGNAITGEIPLELMNLSKLTTLLLSDNALSGPIPSEIANLTVLTHLGLSRNSLSGIIPSTIGALAALTNLNLSYNNLTGIIPATISGLSNLDYFDLSYNDLSGSIPSGIGNLTKLKNIRLIGNSLTGEIPAGIENLTLLENFDLSDNDLSGPVPSGLGQLNKLTSVKIHYNNLHGLPDMSAISGLTDLLIQHNNFDFGDIEPNINVQGIIYAPQDSIGEKVDTMVTSGNELILSVDAGGSATKYQWMKDGADIAGATDKNYTISAFTPEDAGVYICRMNNTIVTQLTLYSREFIVGEYVAQLDISDVQFVDNPEQNDSSLYAGQKVKLQGLVMTNPRDIYLGSRWGVFITDPQNPLDAWSSIIIVQNDTINTLTGFQNVKKGDIVNFTGGVVEYSGLTELILDNNSSDAVQIVSSGNSLPSPEIITLSELLKTTVVESWESTLLKINNVTVKDTANSSQMLPIDDGNGNNCYIDDYFLWFRQNLADGSYKWPVKDSELSVVGFFRQLNDIYGNRWYTINPRDYADMQLLQADFNKITDGAVVSDGGDSRGVVFADFNNDDYVDLFILNRNDEVNFYYKNNGGVLERQTTGNIVTRTSFSRSATAGDYDNDGNMDIFIANSNNETNELWKNDGTGNFDLISSGDLSTITANSNGSSWGDFNNDGYLDLYIANGSNVNNLLFKNNGGQSFTKITDIIPVTDNYNSQAVGLADTDNDGDLDIFVSNMDTQQENSLYVNNGNMTFSRISEPFTSNKSGARAVSWADFDNDGDLDLFVTNSDDANRLYKNNGANVFENITNGDIVNDIEVSQACLTEDFDNDGLIDIYVINIGVNSYYKNTGDFNFSKISSGALTADTSSSLGGACADLNNDGFTDILVPNAGGGNNYLYMNNGNGNNWLKIKLEGQLSNRSGIGAKVFVKTFSGWQMRQINAQTGYLSQSGLTARFGLGSSTLVEQIRIEWPSGASWDTATVAVNQFLKITEPSTVSVYPIVETGDAVNIGSGSAQLKGSITTKDEKVMQAYFVYGLNSVYSDSTPNFLSNPIDENSTISTLVYQVSSLTPNSTYYFRLKAVTENNRIVSGDERTFQTTGISGGVPMAVTKEAGNIMVRSAVVNSEVEARDSETTVIFKYDTDANFSNNLSSIEADESPVNGTSTVTCSALLNGLEPNTTYYYRVVATNAYGSMTGDVISFTTAQYDNYMVLNNALTFPEKRIEEYKATDFRLYGIPGNTSKPLQDVMGGTAGEDWIAYWDNGSEEDFLKKYDGSSSFKCLAGRGYWVLKKGVVGINETVPSLDLNGYSEAVIQLHQGWNIITNPFNEPISWNDVKLAYSNRNIQTIGDLWSFNGTFNTTATLEPFKGYYVYTSAIQLNIPYLPQSSKKPVASIEKMADSEWRLNIILHSDEFIDHSTVLGVSENANIGFDPLDSPKPHAVGEIVNVSFDRPDWGIESSTFACDIRPLFDDLGNWDFTVNAASGQAAELSFGGVDGIPEEFGVFLIDETRSTYQDLRQDGTYNYTPAVKAEQFTVVIGRDNALQDELTAVVPLEFKVENNFPNPFNPETTIPLQLPKEDEISITIYNILGEKITTLHQGKLAAGRHLFTWRAGNIPSGIYFYRISSVQQAKSLTGKMILMK